jgi:hypothetical protein
MRRPKSGEGLLARHASVRRNCRVDNETVRPLTGGMPSVLLCSMQKVFTQLQLLKDRDGSRGGVPDNPRRGSTGGVVPAFERGAAHPPPVDVAAGVAFGVQAAAAQVLDCWSEAVIWNRHDSLVGVLRVVPKSVVDVQV